MRSEDRNYEGPVTHTDPALHRDALEFHKALGELLRIYQFRDRKRICCNDISVTQCYALDALVRRGSLGVAALADELYLDKSTTSRVVDALERKGYLERTPDPRDGRSVALQITSAGRALCERIEEDLIVEHERLLADFDPEVRQAMARLIARLAREAHARFSRVDGSCCPQA